MSQSKGLTVFCKLELHALSKKTVLKISLKGVMSPHTHARANENKLEKVGPSFSSSVGDFGRLLNLEPGPGG